MPLVPNFTAVSTSGSPNVIKITDTSTGTDASITTRRITFSDKAAKLIYPVGYGNSSYVTWAVGTNTIDVDVLKKDMAITITVAYYTAAGALVTSKTSIALFTLYSKTFLYSLTQYQASNPSITQDTGFYNNKAKLYAFVLGAENAILMANDISGAQLSLDQATYLTSNPKNFF